MSLINKMLQDLDKRGATPHRPGGTISEVEALDQEIEEDGGGRRKVIVGVIVVALVAVLAAGWFTLGPGSQRDERVAVVAKPAPAPPPAQPAKPAPPPAPPAAAAPIEQRTPEILAPAPP